MLPLSTSTESVPKFIAQGQKPRQLIAGRAMSYVERAAVAWSAVAAATAFRSRFIRQNWQGRRQKGGSCCYRTPRCSRQQGWMSQVSQSPN